MTPFSHICGKYAGQPIVVMGGAPCLPADIEQIKHPIACWISANDHGYLLRGADYIVSVDQIHQGAQMRMDAYMRQKGVTAPMITRWDHADYLLPTDIPAATQGNSGIRAVWIAQMLGAWPVIITGMEFWRGGMYWEDPREPNHLHQNKGSDEYRDQNIETLLRNCDPEGIRVVSGVLEGAFKAYDPNEVFGEYQPHPIMQELMDRKFVRVRFKLRGRYSGITYDRGAEAWLSERDAVLATRQRVAVLL